MRFDNPASRLHGVLVELLEHKKEENCKAVWISVLRASNEIECLQRLGIVLQLPADAAELVAAQFPDQLNDIPHWREPIVSAFANMNLAGPFGELRAHITAPLVTMLSMTGALLHSSAVAPLLKEDEIADIVKQLRTSLDAVKASQSINAGLKRYVVSSLHALIQAFLSYRLGGALPILAHVEAMQIHAKVDSEYGSFLTDHELGKRVKENLEAAAVVLTVLSSGYTLIEAVAKLAISGS